MLMPTLLLIKMTALQFFQYASFFLPVCSSAIIFTLWWYSAKLLGEKERDKGLYFLMLYGFTMALQPAFDIMADTGSDELIQNLVNRLISIINSIFLILVLPNFEDAFKDNTGVNFFRKYFDRDRFPAIPLLIAALTLIFISKFFTVTPYYSALLGDMAKGLTIIDQCLTAIALGLLGIAFVQTFRERGLVLLAVVSTLDVLAIMSGPAIRHLTYPVDFQLYPDRSNILALVSLSTLSMLLIALALSWVSKSLQGKVESAEQENRAAEEEMDTISASDAPEMQTGRKVSYDKKSKALVLEFEVENRACNAVIPVGTQMEGVGQLLRFFLRSKYLTGDEKYVSEQYDSNIYGGIPYKAAEKCSKLLNDYSGLQLPILQWFHRKKFGRKAGYRILMNCAAMEVDFQALKQNEAFRDDLARYEKYE